MLSLDGAENLHFSASGISWLTIQHFIYASVGKAEHLKFEWLVTPWSKCSQTCGGSGFQVRAAQCMVRLNNVTKSVEGGLCEDAGLHAPSGMQKCGLDVCPHWQVGSWTSCEESKCFTWNTGNYQIFKSWLYGCCKIWKPEWDFHWDKLFEFK